jgi:transcriptional regulator with GAF, ATPase, and Fis domain
MTCILRPDGQAFKFAANYRFPPKFIELVRNNQQTAGRNTVTARVLAQRAPVQISDATADPEYTFTAAQQAGGFRTILGVPLLREGAPIGVIVLARVAVAPFADKQIELVTTFADQAVIAIENARLFDEVQARTRDLTEALEQQTATSDVLQVISSSPGELEPVFQKMLASATRVCGAAFGTMNLCEGGSFRTVALHNVPHALTEARVAPFRPHPSREEECPAIKTV